MMSIFIIFNILSCTTFILYESIFTKTARIGNYFCNSWDLIFWASLAFLYPTLPHRIPFYLFGINLACRTLVLYPCTVPSHLIQLAAPNRLHQAGCSQLAVSSWIHLAVCTQLDKHSLLHQTGCTHLSVPQCCTLVLYPVACTHDTLSHHYPSGLSVVLLHFCIWLESAPRQLLSAYKPKYIYPWRYILALHPARCTLIAALYKSCQICEPTLLQGKCKIGSIVHTIVLV